MSQFQEIVVYECQECGRLLKTKNGCDKHKEKCKLSSKETEYCQTTLFDGVKLYKDYVVDNSFQIARYYIDAICKDDDKHIH